MFHSMAKAELPTSPRYKKWISACCLQEALSPSQSFPRQRQRFLTENSRKVTSPSRHYLQVFFVVVVDHSQEERHEDVSVDDDEGDEEQGVPGAEVKRWHPKEGERDCCFPD